MANESGGTDRLKRRIEMFWGGRDRPQRGPTPSLTLDQIASMAIEIADAEGLAAVTMQRLAKQLGVSTMALYRYVARKDDLIALMTDEILAGVSKADLANGNWRERLTAWGYAVLDVYHRHPWAVSVNIEGPPEGPNQLELLDRVLLATEEMGIPEEARVQVAMLLSNYVRGFAQVSVGMMSVERESGVSTEASMEVYVEHLRTVSGQHFPSLRRSLESGLFSEDETGPIDMFEFGLQRILDGIEVFVASWKSP